jgi:carbonic anhydrase
MQYPSLAIAVLVTLSLQVHAKETQHDLHSQTATSHAPFAGNPHWSYSDSDHWGQVSEKYATCGQGKEQSPIDITDSVPSKLPPLEFNYQPIPLVIENNGHTIKVNTDQGHGSLKIGGDTYNLLQFHVHTPSEEAINGKKADMVTHLVHQNATGQLAVVAVLFEKGKESNAAVAALEQVMPKEESPPQKHEEIQVNPADLLPKNHSYFTYQGSLTTPPCSEGVKWIVLKTPVSMTEKELSLMQAVYSGNARPLQPLNGRKVLSSD